MASDSAPPRARIGTLTDEEVAAERLELATEAAQVGVWDLDLVNDVTIWDARARALLGAPPEGDVTQEMFYAALHPDDRARIMDEVERALDPAVGEYDTEYRVGNGETRWLRARGRAFFDAAGRAVRFIGTIHDISDEKRREAELQALSEQAQRANRAKDHFLAMLGHELRNPLAPVLIGMESLRSRAPDAPEIEVMERQLRHVVRLVDDLLDTARIAKGKIRLERRACALEAVVRGAVEAVERDLRAQEQSVRVEGPENPVHLHADFDRLVQVVGNLLHNASKFSPGGSTLAVRFGERAGTAFVEVADPGVGIDPARLARLFHPFEQAEQSAERGQGGLGLGLSIVQKMMALHGGEVSAHSDGPGTGSIFRVTLPCGEPEVDALPRADEVTEARPCRVLLVDDNADLCELLGLTLQARGHTVAVAHDGGEALEKLESFAPDVAFIDLGLPVKSGYEVVEALRARPSGPPPRLVAMSGYGQASDRKRTANAGFEAHLVKPVSTATIVETIRRLQPHE